VDRRIKLSDGRALGFAEYGDRDGKPVFYFHGFPGSRVEAGIAGPTAAQVGVRLIAVDRPGFGLSDFKAGRRIGDWAGDVAALADALALERFAALGVSGGGPYLSACALRLGDRLTAAAVFCGLGPASDPGATEGMIRYNRLGLRLAGRLPWSAGPLARIVATAMHIAPERAVAHLARQLPQVDRALLEETELRGLFVEAYREALRQGARGAARELLLFSRPWDFRLEQIGMPVHLWHGELDTIVPPAMARRQQRALLECRARFFPREGHFSVVVHHVREMLEMLAGE
jgi:pimeloyl-ACP methyl ester carboxylesterase